MGSNPCGQPTLRLRVPALVSAGRWKSAGTLRVVSLRRRPGRPRRAVHGGMLGPALALAQAWAGVDLNGRKWWGRGAGAHVSTSHLRNVWALPERSIIRVCLLPPLRISSIVSASCRRPIWQLWGVLGTSCAGSGSGGGGTQHLLSSSSLAVNIYR